LLNGLTFPKLDKYLIGKTENDDVVEPEVDFDSVTDETISALKAKEEGKKTKIDLIEKQIEEKEKKQEPKSLDNNTISATGGDFFEENESGLLEVSGLNEVEKVEVEKVEVEKVEVVDDDDDDFWNS